MAVFLSVLSVLLWSFDLYNESGIWPKLFVVCRVGFPFVLLFGSNLISHLTFTVNSDITGEMLLRFLMLDDDNAVVKQNVALFCEEFPSKLQKGVFVGLFVSLIFFYKIKLDIVRFSQQSSPFYSVCISVFWCYICLSSMVANVTAYMTAIACKLHITVFKNRLSELGNSISTLYLHHRLLETFLEKFRHRLFMYFTCQELMCQMFCCLVLPLIFTGYINWERAFMLGAADFVFLLAMQIFLYLETRPAFNDVSSEMAIIPATVVERRKLLPSISKDEDFKYKWEAIAHYFEQEGKRVSEWYSNSRVPNLILLFLAMLSLALRAIYIFVSGAPSVIMLLGMLAVAILTTCSLFGKLSWYLAIRTWVLSCCGMLIFIAYEYLVWILI